MYLDEYLFATRLHLFFIFKKKIREKKCSLVQLIHAVLSKIFLLSSISVDS
jgi:hypothetical protein